MSRPQVTVHNGSAAAGNATIPAVFSTQIRTDIVHKVFTAVNKNKRQAYAVSKHAGEQTSAESWGTGRAVARIPRVNGSGTYRAGQAAFGNMCRGGRMFAPTKTWRRWHVKTNLNEKRYATASAIAASGVAPLVLARGHRVEHIAEVPLVVGDSLQSITKTKEAVEALKAVGAHQDIVRVINSKALRAGKGKWRNRRHTQRRGPLVIYAEDKGLVRAFRNVPGVETSNVQDLNLLQLAPGAHLGRFVIWTESAFNLLDQIWGSENTKSTKSGYTLPRSIVANADISGLISSDAIQAALRPVKEPRAYTSKKKSNPLRNKEAMLRLNPYARVHNYK